MKTIVNIVSEQTIPNYLFVKEMYEQGDNVIWILTGDEKQALKPMKYLEASLTEENHKKICLKNGGEEDVDYMTGLLKNNIETTGNYLVNLTGGTKLMSLVVYNFFKENFTDTSFYYMPIGANKIININNATVIDIAYKVKVKEYLKLYGLEGRGVGDAYLGFEESEYMYNIYNSIQQSDELIKLRGNREELTNLLQAEKITENELKRLKKYRNNLPLTSINKLEDKDIIAFLSQNNLPTKENEMISSKDVNYLTGGWFEDFVYYLVDKCILPDDILHSITILKSGDRQSQNEIDVIYTKDNKLYVIECKTGIPNGEFNNIADKATAIKSLLGKNVESYFYTYLANIGTTDNMIQQRKEKLNKHNIRYKCKPDIDNELNKLDQSSL